MRTMALGVGWGLLFSGLLILYPRLLGFFWPVVVVGIGSILCAVLFVPRRMAVCERGVLLGGAIWDEVRGTARRWVPRDEILSVWPVLNPGDASGPPTLDGYAVEYHGGLGVFHRTERHDSAQRLESALRTALGASWPSRFKPRPTADPGLFQLLQVLRVSFREHISRDRREKAIVTSSVGLALFLTYLLLALEGLKFWLYGLGIPAISVLGVSVLHSLRVHEPAVRRQFEAFSILLALQNSPEPAVGESQPVVAVHRDYVLLDPRTTEQDAELRVLDGALKSRSEGRALFAWGLGIVLVAFGVPWIILDLGIYTAIISSSIGLLSGVYPLYRGWEERSAAFHARFRVRELVRDEWRTGSHMLPRDFEIKDFVGTFREPSDITNRMLSKARTAARIDSSRLTIVASSGGTVVLFAALFVVNYVLHAPSVVVWFFAALFGWISLWFAIAAITTPGRVMLQSMQDYEEVTGKTVIPEDIRSIVETSDAR